MLRQKSDRLEAAEEVARAQSDISSTGTAAAETPGGWGPGAALASSLGLAACGGGGDGGDASGAGAGAGAGKGAVSDSGAGDVDANIHADVAADAFYRLYALGGTPPPTTIRSDALDSLASTPTGRTWGFPAALSDAEAARFLLQAQLSASPGEIAAVRAKGYMGWLSEQFTTPRSHSAWYWIQRRPFGSVTADNMMWSQLIASPDGARKRMALALSEIFVISIGSLNTSWIGEAVGHYWDTLAVGVTSNFRALLEAIALNPAMGAFLNTRGNQKENAHGREPDENFAREVMQLMTIGLYQLDAKGNVKTAADGVSRLPSYTQSDVSNLARVFTGYDLNVTAREKDSYVVPGQVSPIASVEWTRRPMKLDPAKHSMLEARFLGVTVPANTDAATALKIALDALYMHPNVGPFLSKQLIQRLVTSNPSPDYVGRVAAVFNDNGAGVRGDMQSVFSAVLLDNEARSPLGLTDPNFGRLREPMLRLTQWARTFGAATASGDWKIGNTSSTAIRMSQSPMRAPSVFNFFRPGYVPPSTVIARAKLVAPEFQIVSETTVGSYINYMQQLVLFGSDTNDVVARYTSEKFLVLRPAALVKRLNLLLCANQMSAANCALITDALATPVLTASSRDSLKMNRICAAVLLVMASPEYLIQK